MLIIITADPTQLPNTLAVGVASDSDYGDYISVSEVLIALEQFQESMQSKLVELLIKKYPDMENLVQGDPRFGERVKTIMLSDFHKSNPDLFPNIFKKK